MTERISTFQGFVGTFQKKRRGLTFSFSGKRDILRLSLLPASGGILYTFGELFWENVLCLLGITLGNRGFRETFEQSGCEGCRLRDILSGVFLGLSMVQNEEMKEQQKKPNRFTGHSKLPQKCFSIEVKGTMDPIQTTPQPPHIRSNSSLQRLFASSTALLTALIHTQILKKNEET